jgi:hypothetical protein
VECLYKPLWEPLGPRPEYCRGYAWYRCSLCHIPVCLWHKTRVVIDGERVVLCPDCLNGYMQCGGSIDYDPV